jgi:hypothetical protein
MRTLSLVVIGAAYAATAAAEAGGLRIAPGPCSVFDRHPCAPVCSLFERWPCIPEAQPPIGQDLRLTIESRRAGEFSMPDHDLDTLADLFTALRACWKPPATARDGMAMSVRFAFKRTGEVIAPPRVTYARHDLPAEDKQAFRDTIMAAFEGCAPLHFTTGLAGAIAGRPIAIRYVENRDAAR